MTLMDKILGKKEYNFLIKQATGEEIGTDKIIRTDKGIKFIYNNKCRFIPYEALLWVDSDADNFE
jgi:hypothetical protein